MSEPDAYYDAWLKAFGEARKVARAVRDHGYYVREPEGGFPTAEQVRSQCDDAQWSRVLEHALCLACLDGNAFPDLVEQYVPEAWVNLDANGWSKLPFAP